MSFQIVRGTVVTAKGTMLVVLRLRSNDHEARVPAVLREAAHEIVAAYGPDSGLEVSPPLAVGGGYAIVLGRGWSSPRKLTGSEPEIIKAVAERLGLSDGVLDAPRPAALSWEKASHRGQTLWPTAWAYLYGVAQEPLGPARRGAPDELIDTSLEWLRARAEPESQVHALVNGVAFPTRWADISGLVTELSRVARVISIVSDDPSRGRYSHHAPPTVVLTSSLNPKAAWIEAAETDAALVVAMEAMRDHARGGSAIEWAGVFAARTEPNWPIDYTEADVDHDLPTGGRTASEMPDIAVPDAFWWQIVGPGHTRRLATIPPEAAPLRDDRYEVTFGQPEQWLPDAPSRLETRRHGRLALAPLLLDEATADRISVERLRQARERFDRLFPEATSLMAPASVA